MDVVAVVVVKVVEVFMLEFVALAVLSVVAVTVVVGAPVVVSVPLLSGRGFGLSIALLCVAACSCSGCCSPSCAPLVVVIPGIRGPLLRSWLLWLVVVDAAAVNVVNRDARCNERRHQVLCSALPNSTVQGRRL